jgi:HAMP domain-containing protein
MSGFKDWKLRSKVLVPALATMVILSVGLGFVIYRQEKRSVIAQARQTAHSIGAQIAADRAMYTEKVVQKLVAEHSDITFADMKNVGAPKTLPLPASFVHLTSNVVNSKGLHTVDLLSLWNINPDKKPPTEEIRHALEELVKAPDQQQEIIVDQGPTAHFTSFTADMASAQGCVDCHNRLPESPKHDFRLGDVMGGLMVSVPLTKPLADASDNAMLLTVGLIGVFGIVILLIASIQWTYISKPLLKLERSADAISLGELEDPVVAESKDEVGSLALAFERMRVSLARAMANLEKE